MTTLKMDGRFGSNRLDRGDQGVLGKPLDRLDGVRKVTGGAVYTADWRSEQPLAVGCLVCSTKGTGRVTALDVKLARQSPGVLGIYPRLPGLPEVAPSGDLLYPQPAEVRHVGAPLALVVAETFEQARAAALLVRVSYEGEVSGRYSLNAERTLAKVPGPFLFGPDHVRGSKAALPTDTAAVDVEFTTPPQSHAAMEPHATIASWQGDKVTLRASYQMLNRGRQALARVLGIAEDRIRLISTFVGGGFGGKTGMSVETVFAAQASRLLGRPVKVVMTRRQVFSATSRRSETIQRISLVARADKGLAAIGHHSIVANLPGEIFWEPPGVGTMALYASDSLDITHRLAELDLVRAGMMRAPGEAVGMLAFEIAMDELAEKLGKDPVALRIECEPVVDPLDGKPFSARNLVGCLEDGARRFGWNKRQTRPGTQRDGEWLIGMGMASAIRLNLFDSSQARVRLSPDGRVRVETDLTDIGTGSYTVMAQIAAEMLGGDRGEPARPEPQCSSPARRLPRRSPSVWG
jgi:xanthine dehydrogenase YagR molybdenum-binding subunit